MFLYIVLLKVKQYKNKNFNSFCDSRAESAQLPRYKASGSRAEGTECHSHKLYVHPTQKKL